MPSSIQTTRLELLPVTPDHVQGIFALESDERVVRYFGKAPMSTLDEAEKWIEQRQQALATGSGISWSIFEKEHNKIIGTCAFFARNQAFRSAVCGYELSPDYWGKGLMHEAMEGMLGYGFESLLFNRVVAGTATENLRSATMLERLGFQREGVLRQHWFWNNAFHDAYSYALLAQDWHARGAHV